MIIAFTVHNRPHYLRETLESWSRVRGIGDCQLVFRCEPGCPEAVQVCSEVDFAKIHVERNLVRAGVLINPLMALSDAFANFGAGFAVLAEEDLTVSDDVLEYFTWCQRYEADPQVLGVTTYQHHEIPGGLAGVGPADWSDDGQFHFWVWGSWRDRWDNLLQGGWDTTYARKGWDWDFRDRLVIGAGMTMIAPSVPRSQHVGRYGGAHCSPAQFDSLKARGFVAAVPPQQYRAL